MTRERVLQYAASKNVLLDKEALERLAARPDFEEIVDDLSAQNLFIANSENVLAVIMAKSKLAVIPRIEELIDEKEKTIIADANAPIFRIRKDLDVTGQSNSEGKVDDFLHLFREKFEFLDKTLKRRQGLDAKPLSRLDKQVRNKEFHFIAMVRDKIKTKNGHFMLVVEDMEAETKCVALKQDEKTFELVKQVLLDDVIAFKAVRGNGDLVIIKDVIWPELPQRPMRLAERDVYACIISDIHVGSKLFLESDFNRFLDWINGRSDSQKEREDAQKVKYLFIVGDNVDGIGVYPNQFDNLSIVDINKQYERLEELLLQVPSRIEMFMIPGQHDAVRRGEPQPAIPPTFMPKLAQQPNFHLLGNPSWVEIENGIKVLMYHGASLHDAYSVIDGLKTTEPQNAILEMLKRRDLMAGYGIRNPYVPEKKHYLLIREEPDIYLGGDMHHTGYARYRGCLVVNSSCWQSQTDFEVEMGNVPTPGIVPIIKLKTGELIEKKFLADST